MPAKKDKDDEVKPKASAKDMDPDLEAKRSGPPMTGSSQPAADAMPKPLADPDAGAEKPSEQFDRSGPVPDPVEVEKLLKDPDFDPEGHERLRLAEESRRTGEHVPTTTDVDEHGNPMMPDKT